MFNNKRITELERRVEILEMKNKIVAIALHCLGAMVIKIAIKSKLITPKEVEKIKREIGTETKKDGKNKRNNTGSNKRR